MPHRLLLLTVADPVRTWLEQLSPAGAYEVLALPSGQVTLSRLVDSRPDLIVLDLSAATELDITPLQQRTSVPELRHVPVVGLATPGDWYARQRYLELQVDDILSQPPDTIELLVRIRSLLRLGDLHREVERQRQQLALFVSAATRQLIEQKQPVQPAAGVPREVAILFTDLRGFTAFAATLEPSQTFAVLSQSLHTEVEAALRHGGHVDKIHGDGILAYFDGPDRIEQAVRCALDIQSQASRKETQPGDQTPPVGLAVHVGPVLLGMLGTSSRLDHTIIGDAVNVCARLSGQAKPLQIVVSEPVARVARQLTGVRCSPVGLVALKGKAEPVPIFELAPASRGSPPG
jgi:adenylate cyclase